MVEGSSGGVFSGRWAIGLAALVVVCVITGVLIFTSPLGRPQPKPTAAPSQAFEVPQSPVTGKIKQQLDWFQNSGRGTVLIHSASWETEGNQPPSKGNKYLVLDVEITATEGTLTVNPLYLSVTDSDGGEALMATMAGYQPELVETALPAGKGVRGFASFEVKPEDCTLTFSEELFNPVLEVEVPGEK